MRKVTISPLALGPVAFVAHNIRDEDWAEARATRADEHKMRLAVDVVKRWGPTGAVLGFDHPVCVVGATQRWPNVWTAWMFATDEFPSIAKSVTRYVKDVLLPTVRNVGMVRADAKSLASHVAAHRWMEITGARFDVKLERFGKNGEDFVQYRWT